MKNKKTSMHLAKHITAIGALASAVVLPGLSMINTANVYAAETTTKQTTDDIVSIKNNGQVNGIKIDIKAAPYTTYAAIKGVGEYAYGKYGCAWFASARVKQVTGKGSTIWSGTSWYNTQYKNFGFTRGDVPRAKSLACFEGHVGYVESVSGSDMVISEGGSWYYSDAEHGYCVIRKTDIKKYENGMGSKFIGYVYLDGKPATTTTSSSTSAQSSGKTTTNTTTSSSTKSSTTSTTKTTTATTTKSTSTTSTKTSSTKTTSENVKASVDMIKSKWVRDTKTGSYMYYGAYGKKYTGWHYMTSKEGETTPHWSYFGSDGLIRTGWKYLTEKDGEKTPHWSYFGPNGWLRTGWQRMATSSNPDGNNPVHYSYFGNNGWLRTGLQKMGTAENPDGNSKVHYSYFGNNGWLFIGKIKLNGRTYTFNSLGWSI